MNTLRETHIAVVTNNNDDEKRGRIKVACGTLLGVDGNGDPIEYPEFIDPLYPYLSSSDGENTDGGWFFIPSVGTFVVIELIAKSSRDFMAAQSSIDNADIRWKAQIWPRGDSESIPDEFSTNYPNRRGIKTEAGNYLLFDDTEGSEMSSLLCRHGQGDNFLMLDTQSAYLNTSSGTKLLLEAGSKTINVTTDTMKVSSNGLAATVSSVIIDNPTSGGGFHALLQGVCNEVVALGLAQASTITGTPIPTPTATIMAGALGSGAFKSAIIKSD